MVEGTGAQKEQYAFWFNSGEFIHNYPVIYACGNHDFSDYFDMYVIDTQTEEYGSAVAGNISFDYGSVHLDLMDSNPWALFQMNAETSGGKMHIAPVAEAGHVDMMLAGHTHSYARAVSDQPTVGAGHQSSDAYRALSEDFDDYAGEVDEGKPVEQTAASPETTENGTAVTTETKPEQPKEAGWDVDDSHWAAKTIRMMMAEGVLEGDADGRIRPDDQITRAEAFTLLYETITKNEQSQAAMSDSVFYGMCA